MKKTNFKKIVSKMNNLDCKFDFWKVEKNKNIKNSSSKTALINFSDRVRDILVWNKICSFSLFDHLEDILEINLKFRF